MGKEESKIKGILILGKEEYLNLVIGWWKEQGYKVKVSHKYEGEEGYDIFLVLGKKRLILGEYY